MGRITNTVVNKAVTKESLAQSLHSEIGLSINECEKIVGQFFDTMKQQLNQHGSLKLMEFGSFAVKSKTERIGRNPKTMEEAVISARKVVSFSCSDKLKAKLNQKYNNEQ